MPGDDALDVGTGLVELERCTILGAARAHRLHASTSILDGHAAVVDAQHGCVRFSAWTPGSTLPRRYASVKLTPGARLFTSRRFGAPGYAQLAAAAGAAIAEGAEDGSEMGAFSREMNAIKRRSLLIKYQEYMPVGLAPVVVEVT
jgi:hypothetical protein